MTDAIHEQLDRISNADEIESAPRDVDELAVTLEAAPHADRRAIDDAYRAKYGRSSSVDAMVTDTAAATTLRLLPHGSRTKKEVSP